MKASMRPRPLPAGFVVACLLLSGCFTAEEAPSPAPPGGDPGDLVARHHGPYVFGRLDAQRLLADATGGTPPYGYWWDLDGDAAFEAAGREVAAALPEGSHVVRLRAADADGHVQTVETEVTVAPEDHALKFTCGGDPTTPYWAMEFTASKGTCWMHGGHHTYFTGDAPYGFRAATGVAFSVEQQFSPPTEDADGSPTVAPVSLEVSRGGREWILAGYGEYSLVAPPGDGLSGLIRQTVTFDLTGPGEPFRFLRVRQPASAAQGLSGYLDASRIVVLADAVAPDVPPLLERAERTLSCETGDVLEDFFPDHPCWFGGLNRYDTPSFFHTYFVGEGARLDRVGGTLRLAPWRSDDWGGDLAVEAHVQTSVDGVQWETLHTVEATFGLDASFDVPLENAPVRFVRLFPEVHARYDEVEEYAPLHHPRGFFTHSRITVEGLLPGGG